MVQERRVSDSPSLVPQAEGAVIDSAALMPQSAPFLASANTGAGVVSLAENVDMLYGEGALKDTEPVVKMAAFAPVKNTTTPSLALGVTYKIENGDTLSSISATFGVPIDTIVEFNPSVNFSTLTAGVSIVIPSQNNMTVFAG